jgi:chemotaxis protein MotD
LLRAASKFADHLVAPIAAIASSLPKIASGPSTTHDTHADDFAAVLAGLTPKTQPVEEHAPAPQIECATAAPKEVMPPVDDKPVARVARPEAKPRLASVESRRVAAPGVAPHAKSAERVAKGTPPRDASEPPELSKSSEPAVAPVRAAAAVATKPVDAQKPDVEPSAPETADAAPAEPAVAPIADAAMEKIAALAKDSPDLPKQVVEAAAKAVHTAPQSPTQNAVPSPESAKPAAASAGKPRADMKSIVQSVIARAAAIVVDRTQRAVAPSTEEIAARPAPQAMRAPLVEAAKVAQAHGAQAESVASKPATPAQAEPAQTDPAAQAEPAQAESAQAEPVAAEPAVAPAPAQTVAAPAAQIVLPQIATNVAPPAATARSAAAPAPVVPRTAYSGPDMAALAKAIVQKSGQKSFEIRLDPPELGRVEVHLSVGRDGKAQATLYADKPATLALLQRDSQNLERALKDAGLDVSNSSLNFSLKDGQRQGDGGGASTAHTRSLPDAVVARSEAVNASLASLNLASDGARLDIRV